MNASESTGKRIDIPLHLGLSPPHDLNYIKFYRGGHVKSVKATPVPLRLRTSAPWVPWASYTAMLAPAIEPHGAPSRPNPPWWTMCPMDPEGLGLALVTYSHGAPGTHGPPPTYLLSHRPEGAQWGEASCHGQPLIDTGGSRPEISFGPTFGLKVLMTSYVGHHPAVRVLQSAKTARAPEPRNNSPSHWITSLARASSVSGMVRPSALAVLTFTAISNFVGNCTGRSPGFMPRRMRST
jgi:hypothetical protein